MDLSVSGYIQYLKNSNKMGSARNYRFSISAFERWLRPFGKDIDTFSINDVNMYIAGMGSPKSANLFRSALIGYMKYRAGSLPLGDPMAVIEFQKVSQIGLVVSRRMEREIKKTSLTPTEVNILLDKIKKNFGEPIYSFAMFYAYFGARPGEVEGFYIGNRLYSLANAKIDWKNRKMIIMTEKTHSERLLFWNYKMDKHIHTILDALPVPYPARYFTLHMYRWQSKGKNRIGGIATTAKTFRRTFQTNQRLLGQPDILIDHELGHVSKTSSIGDVYTDFSQFEPQLREMMDRYHYMIIHGIL
jgi:integrase